MHEWALAEAVITAASKIAVKEELKEIKEIIVKIGELQQVDEDILIFAFNQLKKDLFRNTLFYIVKAKSKLECRVCGFKWDFKTQNLDENTVESIHFVPEVAHAYIKCLRCGSPDFEIIEGRGIWLEEIRGVK
ncbi:MAG: hydrogenase nickel incorporation protein HypA [Candidatus Bathyarchaeota archaeon]|nr:hydrogenase nickel incorporation protein HypA [Candidatus Bathyarchaeota archaeon]